MAGGHVAHRHLSRDSSHRQALLRNLVTALVEKESIRTTWPKAKEAQRLAEKLITLAKRNNETSRRAAQGILYTPQDLLPKLFGELRQRYLTRPGGYTRVLRTEPKSQYDQGDSALLQFVDGPRDLRYAITAAAVARDRRLGRESTPLTVLNRTKALRYRGADAEDRFEAMVSRMRALNLHKAGSADGLPAVPDPPRQKKKKTSVLPAPRVAGKARAPRAAGSTRSPRAAGKPRARRGPRAAGAADAAAGAPPAPAPKSRWRIPFFGS